MSADQPNPFNDTLFPDLEPGKDMRLLAAYTGHYVDVVHAAARRCLEQGEHPDDVMAKALESTHDWLLARGVGMYTSLASHARYIEALTKRVEALGPELVGPWFRTPLAALGGISPLEALVRHRFLEVKELARHQPRLRRVLDGRAVK